MPSYSFREGLSLTPDEYMLGWAPFAHKLAWFMQAGYEPHTYQGLFHSMSADDSLLVRYRHLVAGRRGGKTLSAAWEVLYYALHPDQWHLHAHGEVSDKPLHIWVLTKDLKVGRAALLAMRECVSQAGLKAGVDYKENRGDLYFEFPNGTLVEFKTAVDPQSLRGAGLDLLWLDEAAFIPSREAWDVVKPALMNKRGGVICTTTPAGKNWYWHEFFEKGGADHGAVEYRSIDNPYFPKESWIEEKLRYHPLLFKQEYEASFDSMAGRELPGDWLTKWFYDEKDFPKDFVDGRFTGEKYIGVDPASSLSDDADRFVVALIGVSKLDGQTFLLDMFAGRIPFAEQLQLIQDWHLMHRPQLIGIESTAYQAVLAQQVARMPHLPPVVPMIARGKKFERILSMSPLFRVGKVRVKETHRDFIEEWLNYDSTLKNPEDDCLDAVEIALRTAGALMPVAAVSEVTYGDPFLPKGRSLEDMVKADLPGAYSKGPQNDEHLGAEW